MAYQVLTIDMIREFVSDYAQNNLLIDKEEFSDTFIRLCMDLAIDEYNSNPPFTSYSLDNFPNKSMLLWGTLWKMFEGKAVLYARNQLSYADGGLQIPIEEKAELYRGLAGGFQEHFKSAVQQQKTHVNMEDGWGQVTGDQAYFPIW